MLSFEGFEERDIALPSVRIHARIGGRTDAPPLLLMHGFPQSHVMWRRVALALAPHFRLVLPDLRGYGDSAKPPGESDHGNYSKRTMAADMHSLMAALGHERTASPGTTVVAVSGTAWRWTSRRRCRGWRCSTSRPRWTCGTAPTCAWRVPISTGSS